LIGQLTQFQHACRDAARRVGLVPFVPDPAEPFNPERHQWADGKTPPDGARVAEVLAAGYTFQGRRLRPALVRVQAEPESLAESTEPESVEIAVDTSADPDRLPLESESANPA
jgi:hypothetical protein